MAILTSSAHSAPPAMRLPGFVCATIILLETLMWVDVLLWTHIPALRSNHATSAAPSACLNQRQNMYARVGRGIKQATTAPSAATLTSVHLLKIRVSPAADSMRRASTRREAFAATVLLDMSATAPTRACAEMQHASQICRQAQRTATQSCPRPTLLSPSEVLPWSYLS